MSSTLLWSLHVSWNIWGYVASSALACGTAAVVRRLVERKWPRPEASPRQIQPVRVVALSVVAAAVVLGAELVYVFGSPEWISQTTDDVFHLNSVRYMIDSGDGSIFSASLGLNGGPPSAYPAAWHSFAALIALTSDASVPEAATALNLVIGAVVWPVSAIFFVRQLFGNNWRYVAATGLLSTCLGTFPFRLLDWGVLYPNFLSTALVLSAAGLVVVQLRRAVSGDGFHPVMTVCILVIGAPGMFFSHPSGVLIVLGLVAPLVVDWWIRQRRSRPSKSNAQKLRWPEVTAPVTLASILLAWILLRPQPVSEIFFNPPYENTPKAIGEALWLTHSGNLPSFAVGPLVAVGVVVAFRRRKQTWFIFSFLIFGLLFVAVAGFPPSELRTFLTGVWYDDYNRVAAALVVVALPMAVLGLVSLPPMIRRGLRRAWPSTSLKRSSKFGFGLLALTALVCSFVVSTSPAMISAKKNFAISATSPMLSSDEMTLYQELGEYVGSEEAVVGDPWNGSGFAYLYSGVRLTFNQIFTAMTPEKDLVARNLRFAARRPDVCAAVRSLNIHYVLQSDQRPFQRGYPRDGQYDGLFNIDYADGFIRVTSVGTASLYKVTTCWGDNG
ncbi:MAG: hypothetical protein NTU93_16060 [Arthrobacter sp.]|nr:hypothetical protein [Arthrobacter sp.]